MGELKKNQIALWQKFDKNGKEYYSISVEIGGIKHSFRAFQNKKSNDKQPDFKGDSSTDWGNNTTQKKEFPVEVQQAEINKGQSIATKRLQEIREKIAKNDFMGEEDIPF